jgi:methylated-DNA-protein-cysteine methyltransferase related protein
MEKKLKKILKKTQKKEQDNFFLRVYEVVRCIPAGRVSTYGAIARAVGSPQSSRMVGYAMNASHLEDDHVPAHRVVNRQGMLTGKHHFRHETLMQELLESEGLLVEDDCIVDFKKHFWDPYKELI